jgi:hypothetical protein
MGGVPVIRANFAAVAKRSAPAVSPITCAAVSGPHPTQASSAGR